jgi:phosphotriesterase-related protein
VIGLGRFIPRIVAVAEQVPEINIVVATGVYTYNEVPMYFHFQGPGTLLGGPEPMTELFVREIREGIGDSGVCGPPSSSVPPTSPASPPGSSGCCGPWPGPTARRGSRSPHTPRPHRNPGGSSNSGSWPEEGVDLSQVVIGHSGGTVDTSYHEALLANGSYLGFDHFGIGTISLEDRVASVKVLCERGHADRIVLSHDAMCHVDWFPPAVANAWKDWRWTHIPDDVLPLMRRSGISEEDIVTMMVDNPRRILEGCEPY